MLESGIFFIPISFDLFVVNMLRIDFLKTLISSAVISQFHIKEKEKFQKIYINQFFVAGFQYYEGHNLLKKIKVGDFLTMIREPDNRYDNCAIALHWKEKKIGFVPGSENSVLAALIDANDLEFLCEVTFVELKTKPWENVAVAISYLKKVNKERIEPIPDYLIKIEKPLYRFKSKKKRLTEDIEGFSNAQEAVLCINEFPKHLKKLKKSFLKRYPIIYDEDKNGYLLIDSDAKDHLMYEIYDAEWMTDTEGNSYLKGIFDIV